MISIIAQYRVKKDKLEIVKHAINDFVNAIKENEPGTLVYEAFQMPDKVSFIHFMSFKDETAQKKHEETKYLKKFVDILYPNCEQTPEFTNVDLIKSNRI